MIVGGFELRFLIEILRVQLVYLFFKYLIYFLFIDNITLALGVVIFIGQYDLDYFHAVILDLL